jgi:hypothetical protein
MVWPLTFPAQCPPEDALSSGGYSVYCFVGNDPPRKEDFLSQRQRNPGRKPYSPAEVECKANGISVFTRLDDLYLLRGSVKKFRQMQPAQATLGEEIGVIKHTPGKGRGNDDSHYTLWLEIAAEPETVFRTLTIEWDKFES